MLYAMIMAGGSGTRFWPASRKAFPKQLLALSGDDSMLQSTVNRLDGMCQQDQILILTNRILVDATQQQLPGLPAESIIGEPCKRDTAPCVGLAARLIAERDPDANMLVMPADHVIQQKEVFQNSVRQAEELLNEDPTRIMTFGIQPSYPATVFGYIERGSEIGSDTYQVKQFREKPDLPTAKQFLDDGSFYWNAGIFLWRASTVLDALRKFEPEMADHIDTIGNAIGSGDYQEVLEKEFTAISGKSIDYAVMEHYDNVCVVQAPFDWDDVGNWTAVPRLLGTDGEGNAIQGKHLGIDTKNSIIRSDEKHLVVTLGINDCIVVHTPDATLVADRNDESAVKEIVKKLEELGWEDYL